MAIRSVASAAFAFPVLRDLADGAMVDCEIAADRMAVERAGKPALASAITKIKSCSGVTFDADAVASIDGFAERVRYLTSGKPPRLRPGPLRVAATIAAASLLVAVTIHAVQALRTASDVTVTMTEGTS